MTIPLQTGIVYGPMKSRRFGRSLGINLLPENRKVCTFGCLYCQYEDAEKESFAEFPSLEQIEEEADAFFSCSISAPYDWITIAGNGEPTLYPQFSEAVEILSRLRDQYLYGVPIGILSNASTCGIREIHNALMKLDGRFMKLDAGEKKTFEALNRPRKTDQWTEIIHGLHDLKRCVIQSMFITGSLDNTSEKEISEWIKIINYILSPAEINFSLIPRLLNIQ